MKKFQIYGLGNALVDMEFEVGPEFLAEHSVVKGVMTLVDESKQESLVKGLHSHNSAWQCGGSAANTIIAAAGLGADTFYSCKVASDQAGKFYYKDLINAGVSTNLADDFFTKTSTQDVTGKCIVLVTPDADRTMNTYLGVTQTLGEDELDIEAIKNSQYLYIEGYLMASESAKKAALKALQIARENNVKTALTFSDPMMVSNFKGEFEALIGNGLDLVFCNESEALSFSSSNDLNQAIESMKTISKSFALTKGARGAVVYDGKELFEISAPEVVAKDTNGAGDLFAGSFLYGITSNHSFKQAGSFACKCASELVAQFGPRLKLDQLNNLKKEFLK